MITIPEVYSAQTVHLSCAETKTLKMDQNKLPPDIHYLGVPSGVPKSISKPMVYSVQTVNLSCAKNNTISKRIKTSFHLTHVT